METFEKKKSSEVIYDGKIIKVEVDRVELPNGREAIREVVRHNGGVALLPITDENEIIFVKQFRYPYEEELLEIPAGKLEPNEDSYNAGIRELKEETGAVASEISFLGMMYPSSGYCAEKIYIYSAEGLTFHEQNLDEDEFLNVIKIPFEKALEMVLNGEIKDGKTQIAVLKYAAKISQNKEV
ncbi:MAG: NUDIX hydrolase [Oscillospiraceae bacterium]|nr:NUDIX hydrolase [Oscillospiraceae bacterium]